MPTLSLLLILLAVAGHLVAVRALLNWVYTVGMPERVWHAAFGLHVAAAIAGPILLIRLVGQRGPAVLRGGSWADVHPAWIAYIGFCVLSLLIGAAVLAWRRRHQVPAIQLAARCSRHDGVKSLGRVPAPASGRGLLARLPGNEIFDFELIEREIRLPRLPAALDGLSVLHLTDLHMNGTPDRAFFEWAIEQCAQQRPDLVALTGDVVDHLGVLDWLPTTLGRLSAPLGCCYILGNHDIHTAPQQMRAALDAIGWTALAGRYEECDWRGTKIILAGTERPWAGEHPTLPSGSDARLTILLAHSPHEARWARRQGIDLMLAGHLHGGQIRWPLIGPIGGGRFAAGSFDLPPAVLHVSRGLGQMAPLRWNCRPEVTKLVLRSNGQSETAAFTPARG